MPSSGDIGIGGRMRPIFCAIRTVTVPAPGQPVSTAAPPVPFITISREAGAGGWTLAQNLVQRLNEIDPGEPGWTSWDREIVERVAADHQIAKELVESLEQSSHTWLDEFFSNLRVSRDPRSADELLVFRRVASTVRALARAGRVVIVGRGGVYLTRSMPGGIHIRLLAPLSYRVELMARRMNWTRTHATEWVHQTDHARALFYKRYFPNEALAPETFTLTINTAQVEERNLVEVILPLIPRRPRPEPNWAVDVPRLQDVME